jgi:hypothetical protein
VVPDNGAAAMCDARKALTCRFREWMQKGAGHGTIVPVRHDANRL